MASDRSYCTTWAKPLTSVCTELGTAAPRGSRGSRRPLRFSAFRRAAERVGGLVLLRAGPAVQCAGPRAVHHSKELMGEKGLAKNQLRKYLRICQPGAREPSCQPCPLGL